MTIPINDSRAQAERSTDPPVRAPRRPAYSFVKIRRGLLEHPPASALDPRAQLLLLKLRTDSTARPIPGVLTFGVAGLSERYGGTPAATRRSLVELETKGQIRFDAHARLLYCVGAIEDDPPCTEQATKAFAARLRDLPDCPIRAEIAATIRCVLALGQYPKLHELWAGLAAEWVVESASESAADCAAHLRPPTVVPLSDQPPPPSDLLEAVWNRLPQPPFAAAAADDFVETMKTITIETFGALVVALGVSKWVHGPLTIPPTLRRLVSDATYRDRVLRGEFAAQSSDTWRCAQCQARHPPLDDCPPLCRGCKGHHPVEDYCGALQNLRYREEDERQRAEQEAAAREKARQIAAERGITEEDARVALLAEAEATRRAALAAALAEGRQRAAQGGRRG